MKTDAKLEVALGIVSGRKEGLQSLSAEELALFGWTVQNYLPGYTWRNILSQCEGALLDAIKYGKGVGIDLVSELTTTAEEPKGVIEYRTVIGASTVELDGLVNAMLADGWQPYGFLIVHAGFCAQVMVKFG